MASPPPEYCRDVQAFIPDNPTIMLELTKKHARIMSSRRTFELCLRVDEYVCRVKRVKLIVPAKSGSQTKNTSVSIDLAFVTYGFCVLYVYFSAVQFHIDTSKSSPFYRARDLNFDFCCPS